MPSVARPAPNVTACCSAMPTSKVRSGKTFWKISIPVPPGIAAVMPTMVGSFSASFTSVSPNTRVEEGAVGCALAVTLALFGHDMDQRRTHLRVPHVLQNRQKVIEVMTVDRTDVIEAEFF